ncbi:MAG: glucoamylase family protein [Pyrinomonadaceae bacterium]
MFFSHRHLRALSCFLVVFAVAAPTHAGAPAKWPQRAAALTIADEEFLEDLERRSFRFFWEKADPSTGLVLDRARTDGSPHDEQYREIASIASTGFGLTALCIAAERRWVEPREAEDRVRVTLRFLAEKMPHHKGWFYHFVNMRTGAREWKSELSSIDTTLLLAGVLTAKQFYRADAEISGLATKIYERIDFRWMLNEHPGQLSMGWHPERGFINSRWDTYSEHPLLYLFAIGSRTHPIMPTAWYAWKRDWNHYKNYTFLGQAPLFTHQYSHAWVDFRGRREVKGARVNYFENSVIATRAHREFCINLAGKFPGYSENVWGITASDSVKGYRAWGGPPATPDIDGTVVPCAAAGSLMFTPDISLPALRAMHAKYGDRISGRYGFTDAFNPNTNWINPDVIGIDVGITLLSAENLRTGNVWRWFMRNPEIERAMRRVGLHLEAKRAPRGKLKRAA